MKFEINFSKYINQKYQDYLLWNTIVAKSKEEAIEKLKKKHNRNGKKINYILSVEES